MIEAVSEDSLLISFGQAMDPGLPARIAAFCSLLEQADTGWLVDLVPAYTTLLVTYDPLVADFREVRHRLLDTLEALGDERQSSPGRSHRIPVWYSPRSGADLEYVAEQAGLTVEEVIEIHTGTVYQVYALGFAPGFAFLGECDPRIALPRKDSPRPKVPAGSVAIANRQTAVYPLESPGGWQLIGRSPVTLFDPESLSLLRTGDEVRFEAISEEEYLRLLGAEA